MRSRKPLLIVAISLGLIALLTGGLLWRSSQGVRDRVSANPARWDVSARPAGLEPVWDENSKGVYVYYSVTLRSKDVPAFLLTARRRVLLGHEQSMLGNEPDWTVFRSLSELDQWDRSRRAALLTYLAASGNRSLNSVQRVGSAFKTGGYWSDMGIGQERLFAIADRHGVSRESLALVVLNAPGAQFPGELIGIRKTGGGFVRLATTTNTDSSSDVGIRLFEVPLK